MISNINSFRVRLTGSFLIFIFIIALVSLQVYIVDKKEEKLNSILNDIKKLNTNHLLIYTAEKDFFENDLINPVFFATGKSDYLAEHDRLLRLQKDFIEELEESEEIREFELDAELIKLQNFLTEYETVFNKTVQLIKFRGFMDYGLEGEMRSHIHSIEKGYTRFNKILLLTMRRHEKDYLIRKDTSYVSKLKNQCAKAIRIYRKNKNIKTHLKKYIQSFEKLVKAEMTIGINNQLGYRSDINLTNVIMSRKIDALVVKAQEHVQEQLRQLFLFFKISITLCLLLSLFLGFYLAKQITSPIRQLAASMGEVVASRFEATYALDKTTSIKEYKVLQEQFEYMVKELRIYINAVKEKNKILANQNFELTHINEEVSKTNIKLTESEDNLKKLNSVKDKFLSIISHDVKAPLNTLKGLLSILTYHPDAIEDGERNQMFAKIQLQVDSLMKLLSSMLEWAKAQTGEINFNPQPIEIHPLLDESIALMNETATTKSITIINEVNQDKVVLADKNMVSLILRNLISNAIKFTHPGGRITVSTHQQDEYFMVCIKDTGIGMSRELLEDVMNPAMHITTDGTNNEKGTGFGLLFCREFVEKNGGKLTVESEPGKGTAVKFTLKNA